MEKHAKTVLILLMFLLCFNYPVWAEETGCNFEDWNVEAIGDYIDPGIPVEEWSYPYGTPESLLREYDEDSYDIFEKDIHGRRVRVIIDKKFDMSQTSRKNLAYYVWFSWARSWAEFQGTPWAMYTIYVGNEAYDTGPTEMGFETPLRKGDRGSDGCGHDLRSWFSWRNLIAGPVERYQ